MNPFRDEEITFADLEKAVEWRQNGAVASVIRIMSEHKITYGDAPKFMGCIWAELWAQRDKRVIDEVEVRRIGNKPSRGAGHAGRSTISGSNAGEGE